MPLPIKQEFNAGKKNIFNPNEKEKRAVADREKKISSDPEKIDLTAAIKVWKYMMK